jgi:hypothetical protein
MSILSKFAGSNDCFLLEDVFDGLDTLLLTLKVTLVGDGASEEDDEVGGRESECVGAPIPQ